MTATHLRVRALRPGPTIPHSGRPAVSRSSSGQSGAAGSVARVPRRPGVGPGWPSEAAWGSLAGAGSVQRGAPRPCAGGARAARALPQGTRGWLGLAALPGPARPRARSMAAPTLERSAGAGAAAAIARPRGCAEER